MGRREKKEEEEEEDGAEASYCGIIVVTTQPRKNEERHSLTHSLTHSLGPSLLPAAGSQSVSQSEARTRRANTYLSSVSGRPEKLIPLSRLLGHPLQRGTTPSFSPTVPRKRNRAADAPPPTNSIWESFMTEEKFPSSDFCGGQSLRPTERQTGPRTDATTAPRSTQREIPSGREVVRN